MTAANECFELEDLCTLNKQLGIALTGYGMYFTVVDFKCDFNIQIDTKNSVFIDTPTVKNGLIQFKK